MHDFTVVVLEGAYPSSVSVTNDMLVAAGALAVRAGVAAPRWRLCSVDGGPVALQTRLAVQTTRLPLRSRDDRSTWLIPGLGLDTAGAIRQRMQSDDVRKVVAAVARHVAAGGQVAASCSAVFLLQAAGLLRGRKATTSWWLAPLLKRMEPQCTVDADRMVCTDGPVTTAGAAFAQTDLMLHLLRAHCGSALADAVSRMLLIDARQAQAPFVVPEVLASGNELVARLTARVEAALPKVPSVTELAGEFCMSERTLARHIQRATGKSTLALVHSVKLRRARALLESSRMSVDQVAESVGYQDATALRRLMKKVAGANPSRFRATAPTR
ncbi:MAG TPA: helix-turn-helix domain-containing protein [Rhizobacter sp.]|nr:helix-turn-helix domain-containing protein [Rhizobacter sp.]